MSTITQHSLFSWENVDRSPEIVTLKNLLDALPDQALLEALREARKGRRDDYPMRALWRAAVAGVALGHPTVASLIRELKRNAELREVCGFDPLQGERAVPRDYVFSRFFARLENFGPLLRQIFRDLVGALGALLPEMGRNLAVDSKALVAQGPRSADARQGTKRYESVDEKGMAHERIERWRGWKLHLLADADAHLPLDFELTPADVHDSPRLMPLVDKYQENQSALHRRAETLSADKAYDHGADKERLYDRHGMAPLIPPRDTTAVRQGDGMQALDPQRYDTIHISPTGEVSCRIDPFEPERDKAYAAMEFHGYEKDRDRLKFRCPAAAYGLTCKNRQACRATPAVRDGPWGRIVRVPRQRDPRVLLPIHAHSRRFAQLYKKRTAIERIFGRLDTVYGFETARAHSRQRMETRVSLALIAMLATARSWIERQRPQDMRRLLCAA